MEQSPPSPSPDTEGEGLEQCWYCKNSIRDLDAHLSRCDEALASAREIMSASQRERLEACQREVEEVLEKYGMRITTGPVTVNIVPA